jgi:thioredoxin-like negative regulator of GroEL
MVRTMQDGRPGSRRACKRLRRQGVICQGNVDEANELAAKYNIFSIPTLMILNKGQVIAQQVGAASKEAYKNMIERALSNA